MTSGDFASNRDNFCYRHPKRQSFVLCQRCARTICGECQTVASVGFICPECIKEQRKNRTPAVKRAQRRWRRGGGASGGVAAATGSTPGMMWIFILTAVVFLLDWAGGALGFSLNRYLMFFAPDIYPAMPFSAAPELGPFQPWRILTVALTHSGFFHVLLNMLALWMIGRQLEPLLGTGRFVASYLLSVAGGSLAVTLLAFQTPVVGASGAIFGMFGCLLVIGRHLGANMIGLMIVLGINLVLGFLPGMNVSWQSHVGGLIVGALCGFVFTRTRRREQRTKQKLLLGAVGLALLVGFCLPPLWGYILI
ncbi:rhomboid family intramembrane serine protease [Microbacterium halophytorum]|uniref:rhomboid family intramembrane serine protease n=1 Tax=Microbacterium halophytorum TaxID=2067568 RepID=UPI000CFAD0F6|nr:rhomboid family intramembrane serine protease [Microbacterium halophytorum]